MSYPLPPATRAIGTIDPPADMNKVISALIGMGEPGYVKPSGDTTGATDTAAVAAASAVGGTVFFGPATYYGNFTKQAGVIWQGSGRNLTTLTAPAASNADVVQGANFSTLTCTGSTAGISGWAIRDLTIDGNSANQSGTSYGLRVYGTNFDLSNVTIRNCFSEGLYTEWSSSNNYPAGADKSMEARYYGLKVYTCGGTLWRNRGPHDSRAYDVTLGPVTAAGLPCYWGEGQPGTAVTAASNGVAVSTFAGAGVLNVGTTLNWPAVSISGTQGAIVVTGLTGGTGTATITYTGVTATTFTGCTTVSGSGTLATGNPVAMTGGGYSSGGHLMYGAHTYGASASWGYILDTATHLTGCVGEVATTGMVLLRGGGSTISGGLYFVAGGATQTGCGIQVGDTVNGAAKCWIRAPVQRTACTSAATACLNIVNDATQNDVEIAAYAPAGTVAWSGTGASGSRYLVRATGQSTTANAANSRTWDTAPFAMRIPDNAVNAATLTNPNGFVDAFNITTVTANPRVEGPNGYEWRLYSDNYVTPTVRLSGALGHIGTAVKNGTTITVAAAAGAGTSPTVTLLSASSDTQGQVSVVAGTTPAAGAAATVTFANAFTAAPVVVITAANAGTSALQPYVTTVGTSSFQVAFNVAPTAAATYLVNYIILARPN